MHGQNYGNRWTNVILKNYIKKSRSIRVLKTVAVVVVLSLLTYESDICTVVMTSARKMAIFEMKIIEDITYESNRQHT